MHLINSHLFKNTPSGDDVLFTALVDKATTLGYTLPSANTLSALNTLIKDMRRIGMIQRLDLFHVYASDLEEETDFRLMNIVNPEMIGTTNGAITWSNQGSEGQGYDGAIPNSLKGWINTGFNPYSGSYNYQLNNASVGAVVYEYNSDKGPIVMGSSNDTTVNNSGTMIALTAAGTSNRLNTATGVATSPAFPINSTGLKCLSRTSNVVTEVNSQHNKAVITTVSTTVRNENICIHNASVNSLNATNVWGGQGVSCAFAGASIPYEMAQNFRQVYNKYLRTIGLQQVA